MAIKKYNIIYADPPWKFSNKNTGGNMNSGAEKKYNVMSLKDICNLSIHDITDNNCMLFMWWVGSMPEEALQVVRSWGFKIKVMDCFTWVKKTKNWKDFFGMGFWTRKQTENCLLAIKGKPKRVNASVRQIVRDYNMEHSKKPNEVRKRIVILCGDLPRLELFAREKKEGFDVWGNEIYSDICININKDEITRSEKNSAKICN